MKKMKKIFALLIAMVMVLGMSTMVFAAGTGSITITPPSDVDTTQTITYTIYKVFDADASTDGLKIRYKLVEGKTTAPAGFTVDAAGNVKYAGGDSVTELSEADIAAIDANELTPYHYAYINEKKDVVDTIHETLKVK